MAETYHSIVPAKTAPIAHTSAESPITYYRYTDALGDEHIVDHETMVPPGSRHVQRLIVSSAPKPSATSPSLTQLPQHLLERAQKLLATAMGHPGSVGSTALVQPANNMQRIQPTTAWPLWALVVVLVSLAMLRKGMRPAMVRLGFSLLTLGFIGAACLRYTERSANAAGVHSSMSGIGIQEASDDANAMGHNDALHGNAK